MYDYRLAHNSGTGFRFRVGDASASVDRGAASTNAWHTVIAWHDAAKDTINIQVDNGTVHTAEFSISTSGTSYPLVVGAYASGSNELDGRIDEVALYKRVLRSARVSHPAEFFDRQVSFPWHELPKGDRKALPVMTGI